MSTVAKFRNNQWFFVEDLHQRRGYHGSITVGDKTMVIGGHYGQPQELTVGTEVFEFLEVTTAPANYNTATPASTVSTPWDSTEHCGNSCRLPFVRNLKCLDSRGTIGCLSWNDNGTETSLVPCNGFWFIRGRLQFLYRKGFCIANESQ